jgi:amino acid transporter
LSTEKKFGLTDAIIMGLGGAIGFEIFVLLDYAYLLTGPSMVSALLLCGAINLLTMFGYSELSASIPEVGGEYTYTKAAFGGFIAFMAGFFRWFASVFGGALAAVVFSQQLAYLVSILVPGSQNIILANASLMTAVLIFLLALLSIRGTKGATTLIVVVSLAIFGVFLVLGFLSPDLTPPNLLPPLSMNGFSGFFSATAYTFTMFVGMRALVTGTPYIKNCERNVPIALILSTVLLTIIYCGVAYVSVGVVPEDYNGPLLNIVATRILGASGGLVFAVAGMIASISSVSTATMVQSSVLGGMSRDGYLPKFLLKVHKRFGTRYIAIILSAIFALIFAFGAVEFLGYVASFASLLVFALVNLSLIQLRRTKPMLKRPFKAPLYPLTPISGIVLSILLLTLPVFLSEDVNAESALLSGLGMLALVLGTYYLRMLGRHRLRVAVGGVSVSFGVLLALFLYLVAIGFVPLVLPGYLQYFLIFVGVVSIVAGLWTVSTRPRKLF